MAAERSRRIRVIMMHPHPPFVCEAGLLRARIYDEGVFGCFGIGRISRIAPGPFEHGRATS